MKAPAFWWRPPGPLARLLFPLAFPYGAVSGWRMTRPGATAALPAICIGNVSVGGSGKTPTAIAIAAMLREMSRSPVFLTRGYGGSLAGPVQVDPLRHRARDVGDEAFLLARSAPTVVSRNRPAGAALAAAEGLGDVIVMDDGLQNPALGKTLVVAVFDGAVGIGSGFALPAGPLRAPMRIQWPRIGAVAIVGDGEAGHAIARDAEGRGKPVFHVSLAPDQAAVDALAGRRLRAFAGIGRPEKFFATCRAAGLDIVETRAFPDHHRFRPAEVEALLDRAEAEGLVPVTTEKDAARDTLQDAAGSRFALVRTLPVRAIFDEPDGVRNLLQSAMEGRFRRHAARGG